MSFLYIILFIIIKIVCTNSYSYTVTHHGGEPLTRNATAWVSIKAPCKSGPGLAFPLPASLLAKFASLLAKFARGFTIFAS